MRNVKYITLLALILILGLFSAFVIAEENSNEEDQEEQAKAIAKALLMFDQAVDGEVPDAIELGQMLQEGKIDPVKSKSYRDNPFDTWQETPVPDKKYELTPLPPPGFFGPELEEEEVEEVVVRIADGIKLTGIMDLGTGNKIAIMRYGSVTKSLKVGQEFNGAVTLIIKEIHDDGVVISTVDGEQESWIGFIFSPLPSD